MTTRRMFSKLLAVSPLLAQAWAAPVWAKGKVFSPQELLQIARERLAERDGVRHQLAVLEFYIQLLRVAPPGVPGFTYRKARGTYQAVAKTALSPGATLNSAWAGRIEKGLVDVYKGRRHLLGQYFDQVEIAPGSPVANVLEIGLMAMMLFYGAAKEVERITDMHWCIFPFCFKWV